MHKAILSWLVILILALVSCATEPETVEVTRLVTERIEVETTRLVEVTRIVGQEVTRAVEVTRNIEVTSEVTRIVERIITATPEPTAEPTITPSPTNTAVPQATSGPAATGPQGLLSTMTALRTDIEQFGGLIDGAVNSGVISCQNVVDRYDKIASYPILNVAGSSGLVQNAHNSYRQAISIFTTGAQGMTQNCRDFLADPSAGTIPFQQWGAARQKVNDALNVLIPAIDSLK